MFAAIASVLRQNDQTETASDGAESRLRSEEIAETLKRKH